MRAGDIFGLRGISRAGCIVIVPPDQYIANLLPLDAHSEIAGFVDAFMT
jgi:phenol 2-monooxygenase (NADPH)